MEININGKKESLPEGLSLLEFLQKKKQELAGVVVEYNEKVIPREQWSAIKLQDADVLEILKFMGGG